MHIHIVVYPLVSDLWNGGQIAAYLNRHSLNWRIIPGGEIVF